MPKLYFFDTGLAVSLLGISQASHLTSHYLRGSLFENMVISELMKSRYNHGQQPGLFFWRDKQGREIDCIFESESGLIPIEIKAGATITEDFFRNLRYWYNLDPDNNQPGYVIYGGEQPQKWSSGQVLSWQQTTDVFRPFN